MEHHADVAVPVTKPLRVRTSVPRPVGEGTVEGEVIAIGWWVDPGAGDGTEPGSTHVPTGTLYLVADDTQPRPLWIKQADLDGIV